ncbi:unnamed protein product [Gongylonema pulchrum]|uniref:SURP motif domain-containing protein n=1 Tax=Gongylonema pulchrum TaxID=637853 RepID=A0A183DUE3_9BILA|nr:unnamed protein product [Gongylonema pulchrum]
MKEHARESEGATALLKDCPSPHYSMIMQYIDGLQYTSIPDYGYIYYLLKHAAKAHRIPPDQALDYDPEHPYAGTETPPVCLPPGVIIKPLEHKDIENKKEKLIELENPQMTEPQTAQSAEQEKSLMSKPGNVQVPVIEALQMQGPVKVEEPQTKNSENETGSEGDSEEYSTNEQYPTADTQHPTEDDISAKQGQQQIANDIDAKSDVQHRTENDDAAQQSQEQITNNIDAKSDKQYPAESGASAQQSQQQQITIILSKFGQQVMNSHKLDPSRDEISALSKGFKEFAEALEKRANNSGERKVCFS